MNDPTTPRPVSPPPFGASPSPVPTQPVPPEFVAAEPVVIPRGPIAVTSRPGGPVTLLGPNTIVWPKDPRTVASIVILGGIAGWLGYKGQLEASGTLLALVLGMLGVSGQVAMIASASLVAALRGQQNTAALQEANRQIDNIHAATVGPPPPNPHSRQDV